MDRSFVGVKDTRLTNMAYQRGSKY